MPRNYLPTPQKKPVDRLHSCGMAQDNQRLNETKILSDLSKIGVPAVHVPRKGDGFWVWFWMMKTLPFTSYNISPLKGVMTFMTYPFIRPFVKL